MPPSPEKEKSIIVSSAQRDYDNQLPPEEVEVECPDCGGSCRNIYEERCRLCDDGVIFISRAEFNKRKKEKEI